MVWKGTLSPLLILFPAINPSLLFWEKVPNHSFIQRPSTGTPPLVEVISLFVIITVCTFLK